MIILGCSEISLSFGTTKILNNISFNLLEGEKAGIVGVNGAGKSTLFKVICGKYQLDTGNIYLSKGMKLGYLEQNTGLDSDKTIWEELLSTVSHLIGMEKRLKQLEQDISAEKDSEVLSALMKEYADLSDRFALADGFSYNSRIKGILKGLGFGEDQFSMTVHVLSGGQKTRLALAKLLMEQPDILLLDEPTNHLDISSLEWLEDFLKGYRNSALIISHDRYFLDRVTTKTIELENNEAKVYNGSYSFYAKQKAVDRDIQQKHYELQQKEITRLEAFIEQQRRWNREKNIIAAESRQKAIDRMEKIEKPKDLPDKMKLLFRTSVISGNDILFVDNLSKEYPGKQLFNNISFKVRKNENVFLMGPNGCGKSTLLNIIVGKLGQTSGSVEYGHNVQVGYYDQEQENLDTSSTVLEEVWNSNEKLTQTQMRNALASFLFTGDDVFKQISILSGGEKSKVSLLKLMLSDSNLLILDEPTNHLDINSREVLEEALSKYEGTILAVSHDRYFVNKLATRILEFNSTSIFDFAGSYSGYQEYKSKNGGSSGEAAGDARISAAKLGHMASKEERARQRKLEKQLGETEDEIAAIEDRLGIIGQEMLDDDTARDHLRLIELNDEQSRLSGRLNELYEMWAALAQEKEESGS